MAARAGPRAEGTDGSDFQHRERVASHYQASVAIKSKIAKSFVPHMFLTVLAFGRLVSVAVGIKYFKPAEPWELVWLISGFAAYIGYGSLPKNHVGQLMTYLIMNFLFGVGALAYGSWVIINRAMIVYKKGNLFGEWKDAPMKIALIVVCLQVQLSGLYQGIKLYRIWTSKGRKEN